ncbi:MAG: hypothetical protein ACFE0Q_17460 [Anaerolineae bacterium]
MKTPAGQECKHYYQDFHRGRNIQECRLVKQNPDSERWHPKDCSKCPVPDILRANADPDMELTLTISKGFMGFGRKLEVTAKSLSDGTAIEDPYVGNLNKPNPGLDIFRQALEEDKDDD